MNVMVDLERKTPYASYVVELCLNVHTSEARNDSKTPALANRMAPDVLSCVFAGLAAPDICRASAVCKRWRAASRSDGVWKNAFLALHPNSVAPFSNGNGQLRQHVSGLWAAWNRRNRLLRTLCRHRAMLRNQHR